MTKSSPASMAFAPGDFVVYAGHGVGQVKDIESRSVGGQEVQFVVIGFDQDGMVLRVPFQKVQSGGLRAISSAPAMQEVLAQLVRPAAQVSGIWNRRMVEYTTKINSGNLLSVAEVVRDLHRPSAGKPRSPGAQMIYEKAFARLSDELAVVERTDNGAATAKLELLLNAA